MLDDGNEKPHNVLYNAVLSNKAMKPSKLKCYLQQKHPEHVDKDLWFFKKRKLSLKRLKLDASGYFQQQSTASVEAFFEVAPQIVKQKKPQTIGETIVYIGEAIATCTLPTCPIKVGLMIHMSTIKVVDMSLLRSYPKVLTEVLRIIVKFALMYPCESRFSALVYVKSKARNQLNGGDDIRQAISKT